MATHWDIWNNHKQHNCYLSCEFQNGFVYDGNVSNNKMLTWITKNYIFMTCQRWGKWLLSRHDYFWNGRYETYLWLSPICILKHGVILNYPHGHGSQFFTGGILSPISSFLHVIASYNWNHWSNSISDQATSQLFGHNTLMCLPIAMVQSSICAHAQALHLCTQHTLDYISLLLFLALLLVSWVCCYPWLVQRMSFPV